MTIETVKVVCPENKRAGYAIINLADFDQNKHEVHEEAAPVDEGAAADLSDDELRDTIKELTGKAPHPKTGRAKLVEKYNELNGETSE